MEERYSETVGVGGSIPSVTTRRTTPHTNNYATAKVYVGGLHCRHVV